MNVEAALVKPGWSIRRVMEHMDQDGQGIALLVDDERRLLATITDGDIRRSLLRGVDLDRPIEELLALRPPPRHETPITAPTGTDVAALVQLMTEFSVRHVPIVDDLGRVVDVAALRELIKEYQLPVTVVVMAGGYGTRLRPITENLPKPMLLLGERPLLQIIIEQLRDAGISRVNLATHYKREMIAQHFGNGKEFGVDIRYVEEDQPLGTAGALSLLELSDEPLLVINGDILARIDFRAMLDFHREQKAEMTVAVREHQLRIPYGVVETDGNVITAITEKPVLRHLINAGIYLVNPEMCQHIPTGQPYDMPDLISCLVAKGHRVVKFPVGEHWADIGRLEDYQRALADVENNEA